MINLCSRQFVTLRPYNADNKIVVLMTTSEIRWKERNFLDKSTKYLQ